MQTKSFLFFKCLNVVRLVTVFFITSFLIGGCATTPAPEAWYEGPKRSDDEVATVLTTGLSEYHFRQKGITNTSARTAIVAVQNKENGQVQKNTNYRNTNYRYSENIAKLLPNTYRIFIDTIIWADINGRRWRNQLSVTRKLEKGFVYVINPILGKITRNTLFGEEVQSIATIKTKIEFKELGRIGDFSDQHTNHAVSLQNHGSISGITKKDLAGGRWKLVFVDQDSSGRHEMVLQEGGKMIFTRRGNKTPNKGSWEVSGDEIKLAFSLYKTVVSGKIYDPNHMAGSAIIGNEGFIWRATKITE